MFIIMLYFQKTICFFKTKVEGRYMDCIMSMAQNLEYIDKSPWRSGRCSLLQHWGCGFKSRYPYKEKKGYWLKTSLHIDEHKHLIKGPRKMARTVQSNQSTWILLIQPWRIYIGGYSGQHNTVLNNFSLNNDFLGKDSTKITIWVTILWAK